MNRKGYGNSETTVGKLLTRRSQIFQVFLCDHILTSYFLKQVKTWPKQKYTRQIWIRLVEYSPAEVSDPSEGPRFVRKLIF